MSIKSLWFRRKKEQQKRFRFTCRAAHVVKMRAVAERASVCIIDDKPVSPPDNGESQVGAVLSETIKNDKETDEKPPSSRTCLKFEENRRKAAQVLRHLKRFHGLRTVRGLPPQISCFDLRRSVRQSFEDVTLVQELTIKTSAKIVRRLCKQCEGDLQPLLDSYIENRFQPVEVVGDDLDAFKRMLRLNVPEHWNSVESAYIPNGHATAFHPRACGGSWNREEFSDLAVPSVAFSSGKPRIVTMYSSYNSEILHPLHKSLYAVLRRKGWLLVGNPTDELVQNLNGRGPLMSYDYASATDNIKAAYVQATIQILIEQSRGLTDEQVRCLRVVGELRFASDLATRGQPMGSMMSFPMLCLINKTVVDLTLTELFEKRKICFKEWSSHRCLINGDDLLLRCPTPDSGDYDRIHRRWGDSVGLVVNCEKTMVSEESGEINSTLFVRGHEVKKSNLAALYMSGETDDVVRVAMEASSTLKEFRRIVRLNAHLLARQSVKFPSPVPMRYRVTLFGDRKIRRALRAAPVSVRPAADSLIPVVDEPSGYDLTREEEMKIIHEDVERIRDGCLWLGLERPSRRAGPVKYNANRLSSAYRVKWGVRRELVLRPLARAYEEKIKEKLRQEDTALDFLRVSSDCETGVRSSCPGLACVTPRGPGLAGRLVGWIRQQKECVKRNPSSISVGGSPETWTLSGHTDGRW